MNRNLAVLLVVVIAVGVMLLGGQYMARRAAEDASDQAISATSVAGQRAPDFELQDMQGKTVKLSDFKGKAVLLNFWATWCGPCKIEMPWFVDLQNRYGAEGLQVIGIAMEDSSNETISKFAQDMGVNYIILKGKNSVGDAYGGVLGLPTTFYIDRAGNLIEKHVGLVSKSDIEDKIKKSLAGTDPHAGHAPSASGEDHSQHSSEAAKPEAKPAASKDDHSGHAAEPKKK